MTANAQSLSQARPPIKRQLRNYLLNPGFQLKYTGMVVGVTMVVASVLGFFAYRYSSGQTQMLQTNMMLQPNVDDSVVKLIEEESAAADRNVLLGIVGGIAVLALSLGFTGILVTHRLVGPAYKMKKLLSEVADGHIKVGGRLRKGDELLDVFEAFERMVISLRARQADEISVLSAAIERAKAAGIPADVVAEFESVRDRMQAELD